MSNFPLIKNKKQKSPLRICNNSSLTVAYGLNSCYLYGLKNLKPLRLVVFPGNK